MRHMGKFAAWATAALLLVSSQVQQAEARDRFRLPYRQMEDHFGYAQSGPREELQDMPVFQSRRANRLERRLRRQDMRQIEIEERDQMPSRGYDVAQDQQVNIAPSEAAAIARDVVPGAKVVGVKLLPSGYYAVTLRSKGSVTRVMVNASDGSVN